MADRGDRDWKSEQDFFEDLTSKGEPVSGEGQFGEIERLRKQLRIARGRIDSLAADVDRLTSENKDLRAVGEETVNKDDPMGCFGVLGVNRELWKSMGQDTKAKKAYLKELRRSQGKFAHPDKGIIADSEIMRKVNEAYEFLDDPENINTYGK